MPDNIVTLREYMELKEQVAVQNVKLAKIEDSTDLILKKLNNGFSEKMTNNSIITKQNEKDIAVLVKKVEDLQKFKIKNEALKAFIYAALLIVINIVLRLI